jgi:NitT/TauT family transport system substrate-binding protein
MNTRFSRAPRVAGALLVLLVAGCTSTSRATVSNSSFDRPVIGDVTVAAIPTADLLGLYVAQDDGLFAQQGLRVTIDKIPSSQAIIADQLAGKVDISAGSYIPYISAQASGAKFRILAEASTLRADTRALLVPANSHITTIEELVGKKIGVNGTNSIGTLLISALLAEHGLPPDKVELVTDGSGFPAMPASLDDGEWSAAFLAEPYITVAEEQYGERVLADFNGGATLDFPIDGYVATQSWAEKNPAVAAAFVRAIEHGQSIADTDQPAVQEAMAKSDDLSSSITALMAVPQFPTGPVDATRIERVADAMLQFGLLSPALSAEVNNGELIASMIASSPSLTGFLAARSAGSR